MNSNYNPEHDTNAINNALNGKGPKAETIIKIICNRTNQQRQQILTHYKASYGNDLTEVLRSELGGNFEVCVLALFDTPVMYDVKELAYAMKGAGTNEDTLIEIIASRPKKRLEEIKAAYSTHIGETLEAAINDEASGDLKNLLVSLLQCKRSDNVIVDNAKCLEDAKELYEAGEGKWGTDESVFNKIFSLRSSYEIGVISRHYQQITGHSLMEAIESEFSGDILVFMKIILKVMVNPHAYFAERVNQAIKGWGTNDRVLIRLLVSRDEVDMPEIKAAYKSMYGVDMLQDVIDDTSGDFKDLLVELASH